MSRQELLDEVSARIAALRRRHPVRVGIDGVDAAGKTTLADELVEPLRALGRTVIRASVDRFHNPAAIRMRCGETSAEGYFGDSFNYAALKEALLEPLGPGGSRRYRRAIFDHATDSPVEAPVEEAPPDAILLFDGVFLHRPEIRSAWDFSIFVRASFETTVSRAEERDLELFGTREAVRLRYAERYVPGQRLYLDAVGPARLASLVIDNDDPANPVIAAWES